MSQSFSTFPIKYFWQIVYVLFNFAKVVVVDPFMLSIFSCHGSFINMPSCCRYACFVMHCSVLSESSSPSLRPVNETCYVYMVAIVFYDHFWLMVSKGLFLYAFISFIPSLPLP